MPSKAKVADKHSKKQLNGKGGTHAGAKDDVPTAPLCVLESHGDCVAALPAGATLLASSASCAHEVFLAAPSALGIQGHPELSATALLERIWPAVVVSARRLDAHRGPRARAHV